MITSPELLARKTAGKLGIAQQFLAPDRGEPVVLMYHGVEAGAESADHKHISDAQFREQVRMLKDHRRVVPLTTLIDALLKQADCRGMVALTFDDGYLNNVQCAAPILREHSMSATFFLTTGFIGADRWAWTDRLEYVVATAPYLTGDRDELLRRTKSQLKQMDWRVAEQRVAEFGARCGVPDEPPHGRYRFMGWDDARKLLDSGFEVGAHTVNHAILSRLPLSEAAEEILGSAARVKAETGFCSRTFCYPNGRQADYTPEVMDICRQHFDAALAAEPGAARLKERFEIRRIGVDGSTTLPRLAARILQGD